MVALMAVSLWLRRSVRLAPGLGPVLRSCLSEVMSFWDLESSREQETGGDWETRRPEGPSEGTLNHKRGEGPQCQESGLMEGQGWRVPSTQLRALGVGELRQTGISRHCVLARARGAGALRGDCLTPLCGPRAAVGAGVTGRSSDPGGSASRPHARCPTVQTHRRQPSRQQCFRGSSPRLYNQLQVSPF